MQRDLGLLQKMARFYTLHTPLKKGRHRVASFARNLIENFPAELLTTTRDGREIILNPATHTYQDVYFLGEYEPVVTEIIAEIVRENDVCLDIGANIGWYSTLMQKLVGENGRVYAFEPVPNSFSLLSRNVKLNSIFDNVVINNVALGETKGEIEMYLFDNLPDGHASLAKFDNTDYRTIKSQIITLDSFIEQNKIGEINFIKADVEGAELMMLKGAKKIFEQSVPPIMEIEMALNTSKGFGYLPNDLIEFISGRRDYEFYHIDEQKLQLKEIKGFKPEDVGANVLCVPKDFYRERLNNLKFVN